MTDGVRALHQNYARYYSAKFSGSPCVDLFKSFVVYLITVFFRQEKNSICFIPVASQGFIWGGGGGGGGGGGEGGNCPPPSWIFCAPLGFKMLNDLPVYGQLVTLTMRSNF